MSKKDKVKGDSNYTAKDIYVLEGLEPVRKRPGMYIGSTGVDGLHHLIWEVVDNSIDEAMSGYATKIEVDLLPGDKVRVTDNGRGIPVEKHAQTKKSALETVMCTLHAGGKFGGESYKVAGGLHGVGVSVVNALSIYLRADVCRDGALWTQEYVRGKPKHMVKKTGKCNATGTSITFEPDAEIFKEIKFDLKRVLDHLRQQAYLTKGAEVIVSDQHSENPAEHSYYSFYFDSGIISYVKYLNRHDKVKHSNIFYVNKTSNNIMVEVALQYTEDTECNEIGFANNIHTPEGGMHVTGFRTALTRAINDYAWENEWFKKEGENLTGDDVREGLTTVISVKLREPQFEGQTKAKLGNPEVRTAVEAVVAEAFKEYLVRYQQDAKAIIEKALITQKARLAAKAAKDTVIRKGAMEGLALPGKLADCTSREPEESELFIVEGDSAGGCFSGDTKIALTDGRNITFENLINEHKTGKRNYCYTIKNDGSVGVALIKNPRKTKVNTRVIKIKLDNDEEIICTPNHRFMLRNGKFKEVKDLKLDDSLMPLYRQYSRIGNRITIKGYEMLFDPRFNRWLFTHRLADKYNLENGFYFEKDGVAVHHLDFNKLNNNPDNLIRMSKVDHLLYHTKILEKTIHREDVKEKCRQIRQSQEFKKKMSQIMKMPKMRKILSQRAKKQWENKEYKNYMAEKFLEFYKNNQNYQIRNNKNLNEAQKKYWADKKNRDKQANRVKKLFENNFERKILFSEMAKKQWNNNGLKQWRSEVTKKQWTPEFREKRKNAYNQTYLKKALSILHNIYKQNKDLNKEIYNQIRKDKKDKSIIRFDTICNRFFAGDENKLKEAVLNYNHKIKSITFLKDKIDVYDIEISETHNFALASGVFVHNSAKQGRNRYFQAILPLRGKILNIEKANLDRALASKEIKALIIALGTAIAEQFDISKLRYHKIVLMADADSDGNHIKTLLLTLFYRYFKPIIEGGFLYVALPPLFRVQKAKEIYYAYSDVERDKIVDKIKAAAKDANISIQRYKGLGEMNPEQLWETTMDPERRIIKQITIEDAEEADKVFDVLMGDEVLPRKNFIQAYAKEAKNLDI